MQASLLAEFQKTGSLGCFALTEVNAGVVSGLIIETTATWDAGSKTFDLHTPHAGAAKNWISQVLLFLPSPFRSAERRVQFGDAVRLR